MRGWIAGLAALGRGPIARGSIASVTVRLLGLGLSFVQGVLTARLLGADGYGTIAFALSLAQIATTVAVFGFGAMAIREISARQAIGDDAGIVRFLWFGVASVSLLSIIVPVSIGLASPFLTGITASHRAILTLAAMLVPALAGIALFRGMAQGFGRVWAAQFPGELLRPALMVMALGASAAMGASVGPADYMYFALGAALLASIAGGIAVWHLVPVVKGTAGLVGERRRWLARALPFLGLGLVTMLQGEINTLLLGWLAGPAEAGLFQPVLRLAPVLMLPVQAAGMRYASRASEFWQRGQVARLRQVSITLTWTTTVLTGVIAAAFVVSGPWLMAVFGPDFRESAPLLWYISAACLFSAACGPIGLLLMMAGHTGAALLGHATGLAANLALGLWLIPDYGATGAVIAMGSGIVCVKIVLLALASMPVGADASLLSVLFRSRYSGKQDGEAR